MTKSIRVTRIINSWPLDLKRAGGWAVLMASTFFFITPFFYSNRVVGLIAYRLFLSSAPFFVSGILLVLIGSIWERISKSTQKVPPLTEKKFWFKRALIDVSNVALWGSLLSTPILIASLGPIGDLLSPANPLDLSFIPADLLLSLIPLLGAAAQIGFVIVLLWRYFTKTFPKDAILFHSKGFIHDAKAVLGYGSLVIGGGALIDFGLSKLGIHLPPQYSPASNLGSGSIAGIFLFAAIGAPFFEELFFRGYIMSILKGRGELFALVVSSLLFGLMHMQPAYFIQLSLVGFILGLSYLRTKNLLVPMLIHTANNAIGLYLLVKS